MRRAPCASNSSIRRLEDHYRSWMRAAGRSTLMWLSKTVMYQLNLKRRSNHYAQDSQIIDHCSIDDYAGFRFSARLRCQIRPQYAEYRQGSSSRARDASLVQRI